MLSEKATISFRLILQALEESLPEGWDILHAFFDAEDDPDFDTNPDVNYLTGILQGGADALDLSIDLFIEAIRGNQSDDIR